MGWEKILKMPYRGISSKDINTLNYIMRDGEFRTAERIMDEIFDLIAENRKLGSAGLEKIKERPTPRTFGVGKTEIKRYMVTSPDYESRDSENKNYAYQPIPEYRYIGE